MEVKMGVDERYNIDVGICRNNVWRMDTDLPSNLYERYRANLFSLEEYKSILSILNAGRTQLQYEQMKSLIRKRFIIRWTAYEIMRGKKMLPMRSEPFTIEEAVQYKSSINIEVISIVDNKIVDESNFYCLAFKDADGNMSVINLSDDIVSNYRAFFAENLKQSMDALSRSKLEYNPMKVAKRMFSYALFTKDVRLSSMVLQIINSDYAAIYQLKSKIATMVKLLSAVPLKDIPKIAISKTLDEIKYGLTHVLSMTNEELCELNTHINYLMKHNDSSHLDDMITLLNNIKSKLVSYCNDGASRMLRECGLLPLPRTLVPKHQVF
jgi:hypothetical protein